MSKSRYFLLLLFVISITWLSVWLLDTVSPLPRLEKKALRHDPDYFLEDFTATVMDSTGKPRYLLQATNMKHYPDDNSMALVKPRFRLYRDNLAPWRAKSDKGLIYETTRVIHLNGNVIMERDATQSEAPVKLVTRDLLIRTKEGYAETHALVKITSEQSKVTAVGMRLYLADGRLELLSNVQGSYVTPRP